jgi:hypothetical protein
VFAAVYIGNTWTPSSYGIALKAIGAPEAGPQLGSPREVRWDEYLVLTPLFQITLKNQFKRYNELSPYREDLRNFYALPILDWSLAFKPQLWAFFIVSPAYAYSLYHFVLISAFVVGFTIFVRQLGASPAVSLIAAFILFFAHFTQVWWTTNAPTFAFAPWVAVIYLSNWRWQLRLPALIYVATLWLCSHLYPPFIIGAVFAMAVLIIAFRPDRLRTGDIAIAVLAGAASVLLVWTYYGEIFAIMRNTEYPGQRELVGGSVPWFMITAYLFPYFNILQFQPLLPGDGVNACEIAVMGTLLPLAFLIFIDHRQLIRWAANNLWVLAVLTIGLGLTFAWMIFPLPAWSVKFLLWNYVPPSRLSWGAGLILTLGLAVIISHVPWKLNERRIVIFCAAVVFAWILSKLIFIEFIYPRPDLRSGTTLAHSWMDWIALLPFLIILIVLRMAKNDRITAALKRPSVLLGVVAAVGATTFGSFNPLQSARPIFSPPETRYLTALRDMALAHPNGYVAVEQSSGAMLNGLGVPSINHMLLRPQLDFFRARFPELADNVFSRVFNRYGQIIPSIEPGVSLLAPDAIQIPIDRFGLSILVKTESSNPRPTLGKTWVGRIEASSFTPFAPRKWRVILRGWAAFEGFSSDQQLNVQLRQRGDADAVILSAVAFRVPRPDVASYFARERFNLAGFVLRLEIEVGVDTQKPTRETIQIWSDDPVLGSNEIAWH